MKCSPGEELPPQPADVRDLPEPLRAAVEEYRAALAAYVDVADGARRASEHARTMILKALRARREARAHGSGAYALFRAMYMHGSEPLFGDEFGEAAAALGIREP